LLVAVAVDDHAESGGLWLLVKLGEIVQHIDRYAIHFDDLGGWQNARPWRGVDVAADRGYGCDLRERFEDFGSAYVSGVEDAIGSAKGLDGLRTQEAVGVGDYADGHGLLSHWIDLILIGACRRPGACPELAEGAAVAT